ncbi:helix-hairpin-helix domain-containing protein [Halolamina sp.]|uniref:helix-hairpin-helix domain-containing protein n=1 Tax=Halolamina sp. TaxID=1940283 RepID=UPI0035690BD8
MYGAESGLSSFVILAGLGAFWAYERYRDYVEPSEEEAIREAYAQGDIGEAEMERRLAYILDDCNEVIVETLTSVTNVGPKTGREIAEQFESVDAVRTADQEDLTGIHGIGESTADAVLSRVRR